MTNPSLRFKKDNGESYPELEVKHLKDIMRERDTKQCISESAPLLSFTIEQGVIDPSEKKTNKRDFLTKDMANKKYALIEYNDIIYNPSNIIYGAIGRNKFRRGVVSPIYAIFETTEIPEYVEMLVSNQRFINMATKYLEGTVVKLRTLKPNDFLKIKVKLPCKEEQRKIANLLLSTDEVISILTEEVRLWEEKKKGVMQKIFSQKVRFKDENGKDYPEWEEKTIGKCCECLDRMRKPITKSDRESGEYPYYGSTNIQDYVSGYLFDEELVLLAEDAGPFNDFWNKAIAQWATGKFWVNNHAHVLRPHEHRKFMFYSLEHKDIRRFINNPDRGKLNQEDMAGIVIGMPCFAEQQKIANCLSSIDEVIAIKKQKLETWKTIKKGLLQQMFV